MKGIGYILLTVGFLAGSYYAVALRTGVPLAPFLVALVMGAVGVGLVRAARRQEATSEDRIRANLAALDRSLGSVVDKARALEADKEQIDVYELRHVIDREFPDDLDTFVQARYSLVHSFGLQ